MRRLAAVVLLCFAAACSRGGDVVVLARNELPSELYGGDDRPRVSQRSVRAVLYFVRTDQSGRPLDPLRLGVTTREVRTQLRMEELVLRLLLDGPLNPTEFRAGLRTAIPAATELLGVSVDDEVATVNLSAPFEAAGPESLHLLRVAQVVYTLTELADVDSVRFRIHGVDQPVVDQDGIAHDRVGAGRYSRFAPMDGQEPEVGEGPLVPEGESAG